MTRKVYPIIAELFTVRDMPDPVDWAVGKFELTTAYAHPGPFRPYPYQIEPINAIRHYDKVIYCWATQIGKSLSAEIGVGWCIDNLPMNAMLCYAKRDTVEDVFEDRIKPMILQIPAIRKYFTGTEKDLRRKKIRLTHMFLRVASSEVPSDIATWAAGLIYASEVAKYRQRKGWDPLESLKRRQEAYKIMGRHKAIFESSPLKIGDALYQEMHAAGTVILKPHYPCPHCKKLVHLTYTQIKEKSNAKGEYDHDPERIRRDGAAWYECPHCKEEITEKHHLEMCQTIPTYCKDSDGSTAASGKNEAGISSCVSVAYQVSRLVDHSYIFVECLARWFAALRKGGAAMQTFINEDMADFWQERTVQISADYLLRRKGAYHQFKAGDIPNEVLILICGVDVQDDGFYYVMRGFGKGMDGFLVRCDFVECRKGLSEGADPRQVAYERLRAAIYALPYTRRDGAGLDMQFGFIDRGGHRQDDVDYICDHWPEMHAYVGLTTVDPKRPLIARSETSTFYLGQSQVLSTMMTQVIASERFHLPADIQPDYMEQVRNQYLEAKVDAFGNTRNVWVKQEPDHYRSCENMVLAGAEYCELKEALFNVEATQELARRVTTVQTPAAPTPQQEEQQTSNYFAGRRGRRW